MTWTGDPKTGTTWRGHPPSIDGRKMTETRHVIDRTFGGSVVYVPGRLTRFALHYTIGLGDWHEWVRTSCAALTTAERGS